MKYFKTENTFGWQSTVPSFATEITEEEYYQLMAEFEEHQTRVTEYVEQIRSGVITLDDVPEEYYQEVYDIINAPEPEEPIDERQALINEIIAEVNA